MCLAVVGRVLDVEGAGVLRTATVDVGGSTRTGVTLAFAPEAGVGDWISIHSGHALGVVDPDEAAEIVDLSHRMTG